MNQQNNYILSAKDIRYSYRTKVGFLKYFKHTALKGVSFDLLPGETLGVLGRNGSGKSTLMRLLAGITEPTSGEISCESGVTRSLLTLGLGFRFDLSGRDNALLSAMLQGASRSEAIANLEDIRDFTELGEFFEQPVKTYSAGMRARLGFATALISKVDILLVDEVLSVGDAYFKEKAEHAMLEKINSQQTVVFISHNAGQINKLCDRAIWLEDGVVRKAGITKEVTSEYHAHLLESGGCDKAKI